MLAAGLANKEIAARLNISDHTAKFHVAAILGKLGAATRTEAVALASAAASSSFKSRGSFLPLPCPRRSVPNLPGIMFLAGVGER